MVVNNMIRKLAPVLLAFGTLTRAEYLRIEQTYGGMECESCSTFVQNRLAKRPGVESVSIDNKTGALVVLLKPGNTLRLRNVVDLVQQSGFTPKETRIVARGTLAGKAFKVMENESLTVSDGLSKIPASAENQSLEIDGIVRKSATPGTPDLLEIRSVKR